ncbi:MAG TPA: MarR family winged helix-turn-helix transcriptional regulator [Polyangiaceae bacterium]|jgi:DNA-binding MarR family transcriptional regulator|nr:MarR family winged helix-turn-helix transcriptional regulator [Polyangiaceae bacterium]
MQLSQGDDALETLECLRVLVHRLRASSHHAEHELGLSGAQLFVLRELAAEPGCTIRRLSERTLTDPSSVSVVLAKLKSKALIDHRRDLADTRRSVLSLTELGRKTLSRAPEPYQVQLIRDLRALPSRHLRALRSGLLMLLRNTPSTGPAPLFFEEEMGSRNKKRQTPQRPETQRLEKPQSKTSTKKGSDQRSRRS